MLGTAELMTEQDAALTEASRPVLPRYARLHYDKVRGRHVLLVPERVLIPDETAVEILQLCDGVRTIADIIDVLAAKYVADRAAIGADVIAMLEDLRGRDFLVVRED